jgi:hypothetical protein
MFRFVSSILYSSEASSDDARSLTPDKQRKTLDIITLFHKPNNPASTRVATLLKQASANAQAEATIDQASDHSHQTSPARDDFELNITEDAPTQDQVQTILEYVGQSKIQSVIKGARDQKDALKKFKENKDSFQRPIVSPQTRSEVSLEHN